MSIPRSQKPFTLFRRHHKGFWFARFKSPVTGKIIKTVSTKKTVYGEAEQIASKWAVLGIPQKEESVSLQFQSFLTAIPHLTDNEKKILAKELRRFNTFAAVIEHDTKEAVNFVEFLETFWNYDTSPYIQNKIGENADSLHRRYIDDQLSCIQKYWKVFFKGKLLAEVNREMIESFRQYLNGIRSKTGEPLSNNRKQAILGAGGHALQWACNKGIIVSNPAIGQVMYPKNNKKREILSFEMASTLFQVHWKDERARLGNMLAASTGLRIGEIQALRIMDIGNDRLYINHSYNRRDNLKLPKNNKTRECQVLPGTTLALLALAKMNPHGVSPESFIFWADRTPNKPAEKELFLKGLRSALKQTGMSEQECKKIVFHSWRHFYTSYMIKKLDKKLLKSQTGHLSDDMIELYGDHKTDNDDVLIKRAQNKLFKPMKLFLPA